MVNLNCNLPVEYTGSIQSNPLDRPKTRLGRAMSESVSNANTESKENTNGLKPEGVELNEVSR